MMYRYIEPKEYFRQNLQLLNVVIGVRAASPANAEVATSMGKTYLKYMEAKEIEKYFSGEWRKLYGENR